MSVLFFDGRWKINEESLFQKLWPGENPTDVLYRLALDYDPSIVLYPQIRVGFFMSAYFNDVPHKIGLGDDSLYFGFYDNEELAREKSSEWKKSQKEKTGTDPVFYLAFLSRDLIFDTMLARVVSYAMGIESVRNSMKQKDFDTQTKEIFDLLSDDILKLIVASTMVTKINQFYDRVIDFLEYYSGTQSTLERYLRQEIDTIKNIQEKIIVGKDSEETLWTKRLEDLFTESIRSSCDVCDLNAKFTCKNCKKTFYCSRNCQKRDWGSHSLICE